MGDAFPRALPGMAMLTLGSNIIVASTPLDGLLLPGEEILAMGMVLRVSYDKSAVNGTKVVLTKAFSPASFSTLTGSAIWVRLKARRVSGPIPYNASAQAVKLEIESFPEIAEANVSRALWHRNGANFEHLTTWIVTMRPALTNSGGGGDLPQIRALPHGLIGSYENMTSYLRTSTVQNATRATRGSVVLRQFSSKSEEIDYTADSNTLRTKLQQMLPGEIIDVTVESRTGSMGSARMLSRIWTITFAPLAGARELLSADSERISGHKLTIRASKIRTGFSLDGHLLSTVATQGESYYAAVFGENDVGYNYPAFTTVAAVASAKSPAAPTAFVFGRFFTNSSLRASWSPPLHDGSQTITSYELQTSASTSILLEGSPTTLQVGGDVFTADVSGLALGTHIYARLRACNSVGCGPYTRMASAVPRSVPHQPEVLITSVASDIMLDVFFLAPRHDPGSKIDSYMIEWERSPGLPAKYIIELSAQSVGAVPSDGQFAVSFGNFTTAMLGHDVSADELETALNRLPSITRCSVARNFSATPRYSIVWTIDFVHYEPEHIYTQMVLHVSFDAGPGSNVQMLSRRTRTTVYGQGYGSAVVSAASLLTANNQTRCYCDVDQNVAGLMLYTISGLFPEGTYLVRVFARNALGFGIPREQNVTLSKQRRSFSHTAASCILSLSPILLTTYALPLLSSKPSCKLELPFWTSRTGRCIGALFCLSREGRGHKCHWIRARVREGIIVWSDEIHTFGLFTAKQ